MASIFRRPHSPFWFCSYRCGDGRWLKKSTKQTDRRKATEFCRNLEQAEHAALHRTLTTAQARKLFNEVLVRAGDEPLENFTIKAWFGEWLEAKRSVRGKATGERYGKPVNDFIAHLGTRAMPATEGGDSQKMCAAFRDAELNGGKSPVTVNMAHKVIASAFEAARRQGYVDANPAHAVEYLPVHASRVEKEIFTVEELGRLLEAAPSDDWRGIILLGAFAGMRLGDALRLKWGNVDLPAGAINFTPAKTARLGKKLTLPIHPEVEAFLLSHPAGANGDAPLFPSLTNLSIAGKSGASMRHSNASWSGREWPQGSPGKPKAAALDGTCQREAFTACGIRS